MTRGLLSATLTALEADAVTPIYFVELGPFDGNSPVVTERLHSGLGTITWGSNDWTGVGELFSMDSVKEDQGLSPQRVALGLSAASSDMLDIVFNTNYYRRPCKVYLGALSSGALVADPSQIFSGFIETIEMTMGGNDSITLTAESELILFKRSRNVRFTNAQMQDEYSGDLGLQFLDSVATQKVVWRGKDNNLGGGSSTQSYPNESEDR